MLCDSGTIQMLLVYRLYDSTTDSEAAVAQAKSTVAPFDCISKYRELQKFVSTVKSACEPVEDAAGQQTLHVVTFLTNIQDRTWGDIKGAFAGWVNV